MAVIDINLFVPTNTLEIIKGIFPDGTIRFVGGCVRDILNGEVPKDIDFCTTFSPNEMLMLGAKYDIKTIPTGIEHGTVSFVINDIVYEITTLRTDIENDGRHAVVEFVTDFAKDCERRDFTMNAMTVDLDGNLYDYFGGQEDLTNGVVRFVGNADKRIKEDYLRILRYVRFMCKYGNFSKVISDYYNRIENNDNTYEAILFNVDGLNNISGERIWMEISKILSSDKWIEAVEFMDEVGILKVLGINSLSYDDEVSLDICGAISRNPITRLSTMLDKNTAHTVHQRFKLSNDEAYLLHSLVKYHFDNVVDIKTLKKMILDKNIGKDIAYEFMAKIASPYNAEFVKNWDAPVFPVAGKDLISLGMKEGPNIGKILYALYFLWENSDYKMTKEELLGRTTE